MAQVFDNSYSWPGARAMRDAGAEGCIRYLSWQPVKNMQPGQLADLHAHGMQAGVVWETTADRARQGFEAGRADAQEANRQASVLGWPGDRPLYYAVDFDAVTPMVQPYFDGVKAAGGRPWGVYGCYSVAEGIGSQTPFVWQCAAWSGNGSGSGGSRQGRRLSRNTKLYQLVGYVLGNSCDANDVLGDWGGWHPDQTYAPTTSGDEFDMATVAEVVDPICATVVGAQNGLGEHITNVKNDILTALTNVQGSLGAHITNASHDVIVAALQSAPSLPAGVDVQALAAEVAQHLTVQAS